MFSVGIRNPHRSVIICVAVALAAWISIAWGVLEMQAAGRETTWSGLKIGLAILPAILAPLFAWNFWSGVKVMAAIRRGENTLARWTVTPAEFAEFAASDKARSALGAETINDWTPPRAPPPSGVEIIFVKDAVLAHDTYFPLITTGIFRFKGVRMLADGAPAIAFQTVTTYANRFGTRTTPGELRVPVSRVANADAAKVLVHYQAVTTGEVIANPGFYQRRVKLGLIAAPIFLAIASVGFVLGPNDVGDGSVSIASLMVIVGLVFGVAALILAGAAKLMDSAQRRKG